MSNSTRTVRPSAEIRSACAGSSGERRSLIAPKDATAETASSTVARKAGSFTVTLSLWTTTISVCGSAWKPASRRMWSARWDWPTLASFVSIDFVPTACPTTSAAITKASQPKTAVFQWLALQRPIRAAMLLDFFNGDMAQITLFRTGVGVGRRLSAAAFDGDAAGRCLVVREAALLADGWPPDGLVSSP